MEQTQTGHLSQGRRRAAPRPAQRLPHLGACELCGEVSERPLRTSHDETVRTFDSFECAVAALATLCHGCGALVMGEGATLDGRTFCSTDCVRTP